MKGSSLSHLKYHSSTFLESFKSLLRSFLNKTGMIYYMFKIAMEMPRFIAINSRSGPPNMHGEGGICTSDGSLSPDDETSKTYNSVSPSLYLSTLF